MIHYKDYQDKIIIVQVINSTSSNAAKSDEESDYKKHRVRSLVVTHNFSLDHEF